MGGKHKVANRTKNNTKPSSSGRSAAVLNSSLLYEGFSTLKPTAGLHFSGREDVDSSIKENYQLVLKKISKKDPTTKLKGLQELSDLVRNEEPEVVKTLLSAWPRFYNILATDVNNRVREATHIAHHEIVKKVKRNIAPYLKQIIAPWFTSQYDNYPSAACAASLSFKDTFPPAKLKDAIVFCQVEILNYIYDNLLVQTAQGIAGINATREEAETKYERVQLMCLQGYAMYLREVSLEQIQDAAEQHSRIVGNNTFWKMGRNKVALIRSAWFQVLSVMCQKATFLLSNRETQVLTLVLNSLEDGEPNVLPHVWECVLLAVSLIQEWWKYINVDKLFMPRLVNVLRQGGQGNASLIYPSLLPLISHLPPIEGSTLQFYTIIFDNMRLGLKHKLVISSHSETAAIATAFVECLQYVINQNLSDLHLCKSLIKYQLLATLEWCLVDEKSCHKPVFHETAVFTQYIGNRAKEGNIQTLSNFFFENLHELLRLLITTALGKDAGSVRNLSKKQIELLHVFEKIHKEKKNTNLDTYLPGVERLAVNVGQDYVDLIDQCHSKDLLDDLCSLKADFGEELFMENLMASVQKSNPTARLMDVYENVLRKWMDCDALCSKTVVHFIFMLAKFLESEDRQRLLQDLLTVEKVSCLCWAVHEAVDFAAQVPEARQWLNQDKIGELFVSIVDMQLRKECSEDAALALEATLLCHEFSFTGPVLEQIIKKLLASLENAPETCLDVASFSRLPALFCQKIYSESLLLSHGDELLLGVFRFLCRVRAESLQIHEEWRNLFGLLLKHLPESARTDLVEKVAGLVEKQFFRLSIKDEEAIRHMVRVVFSLLPTHHVGSLVPLEEMIRQLYEKPSVTLDGNSAKSLCKVAEYVTGRLTNPQDPILLEQEVDEFVILRHFAWAFFRYDLMCVSVDNRKEPILCSLNRATVDEVFFSALYDYTVGQSFLLHFYNVKYYKEILGYNALLEDRLRESVAFFLNRDAMPSPTALHERYANPDWFWRQAVCNFFRVFLNNDDYASTFYRKLAATVKETEWTGDQFVAEQSFRELQCLRAGQIFDIFNLTHVEGSDDVEKVLRAVRLGSTIVTRQELPPDCWNAVVLYLASCAASCKKIRKNFQYHAVLVAVTELYINVCKRIGQFKERQMYPDYVSEWDDVLFESVHADLALIWLHLAEGAAGDDRVKLADLPLLQRFVKVTEYLEGRFIFRSNGGLPKWTRFVDASCGLLTNSSPVMQLCGYRLLMRCAPALVDVDVVNTDASHPYPHSLIFGQFKAGKLSQIEEVVNSVLSEFKVGESTCRVEPAYDSFTYTFAYLLLWDAMLTMYACSAADLRYNYSVWMMESDAFQQLLPNLLRLMSLEVLQTGEAKSKALATHFRTKSLNEHSYEEPCDSDTIEQMACYLYKMCLSQLPALVRQWWSNLDSKASQVVDRLTATYVSPSLCAEELNDVSKHQTKLKNMTIKVIPTIREILAIYTIDESQVELTLVLPPYYPLIGPDVHCNQKISGNAHKQWLLQFKKCVLHQNDKIWDGLALWNDNLDRKFDGYEECYICYAVLHPGSHQLPKLSCRTCRKKFHSACLISSPPRRATQ